MQWAPSRPPRNAYERFRLAGSSGAAGGGVPDGSIVTEDETPIVTESDEYVTRDEEP